MKDPLAIANLVWGLLEAGFAAEAEALIQEARAKGLVHPNLEKAAGALITRREAEEETLKGLKAEVAAARKDRVRYARAMLLSVEPTSITGSYEGDPSSLVLAVKPDGAASGNFFISPGRQATLTGQFRGAALKFNWKSVPPPDSEKTSTGLLATYVLGSESKSGAGVLLFDDQEPSGYWTAEGLGFEPPDQSKIVRWRLRRS